VVTSAMHSFVTFPSLSIQYGHTVSSLILSGVLLLMKLHLFIFIMVPFLSCFSVFSCHLKVSEVISFSCLYSTPEIW
jgi:hypothetical protein